MYGFNFGNGVTAPVRPTWNSTATSLLVACRAFKLIGDGPARMMGCHAQFFLQINAVDLYDHAINLIGKVISPGFKVLYILYHLFDPLGQFQFLLGLRSPVPTASRSSKNGSITWLFHADGPEW